MFEEREVITRIVGLDRRRLRRWVRRGWVRPATGPAGWLFDELDLARLRLLVEMREELGLEEETIALLLPVLDRLYATRRLLRRLLEALGELPEAERRRILARLEE